MQQPTPDSFDGPADPPASKGPADMVAPEQEPAPKGPGEPPRRDPLALSPAGPYETAPESALPSATSESRPSPSGALERRNMAWPPASWERPRSAWRSDLWTGPDLLPPLAEPTAGQPEAAPAERRGRFGGLARELGETILLTLLIFFGIRLVVQNFKIEGMSMEPNLHDGQYLLVNKLAYLGERQPQRGDVIVFESWSPGKDFIKRVIGVPGERVEIRDQEVWIDGQRLDEPYLDQTVSGRDEIDLGQDEYYVMGDNRGNSSDSRSHGPLDQEQIIGKAWFVYWPPDTAGPVDDAHEAYGALLEPVGP